MKNIPTGLHEKNVISKKKLTFLLFFEVWWDNMQNVE